MQRVLLDTDILSEILKQKNPAVTANAAKYAAFHERFTFTAVSVHEIISGLESKSALKQLQAAKIAFTANEIVVPTLDDYETAGSTRGAARRQGHQLAIDDCLIAAVAARLGMPVVTGNTGHYQAAQTYGPYFAIENWRNL